MNSAFSVQTNNLGKLYKGYRGFLKRRKVQALKNVTLQIRNGEIFGLLGLNGAGKTTLLKILLGFIQPTRGEFTIMNEPGSNVRMKRKIGYLPEDPNIYDFFSAEEFLLFCGKIFNLSGAENRKRTNKLLEMLQISTDAKTNIKEFSHGMNQRLAIASALINEPELIFLDEPLSGLDPLGRKLVKEALMNLKKEGKTIFFSSHILAEVEQMCDRIGILHKGELVCMESMESIFAEYTSLENFFLHKIAIAS